MTETNLRELYAALRDFTKERDLLWEAEVNAPSKPNEIREKIARLKAEKADYLVKHNAEVARLQLDLAESGEVVGKVAQKAAFSARMRDEKQRRNDAFRDEVIRLDGQGVKVADMQAMCGLPSPMKIYNILRTFKEPETATPVAPTEMHDLEWQYHNHIGVLRYAMDKTRRFVKFHSVEFDGPTIVLTYPEMQYVAGDRDLLNSVKLDKAKTLESLLNGTYTGEVRLSPNQYAPHDEYQPDAEQPFAAI